MLNGRSFADLKPLFYLGRPRAVRCWDETYLHGRGIAINLNDLGLLFSVLNKVNPIVHETVLRLFDKARTETDGATLDVPDLGMEASEVLSHIGDTVNESVSRLISDLWYLSGRTVLIRRDGGYGSCFLSYRTTLPEDLAPLLVTDASGRCRDAYRDLEARDLLHRLPTVTKRYDHLQVNFWHRGGGKHAWQSNPGDLLKGIALTIDTRPDEEWLVIHHKDDEFGITDIPGEIRKRLKVTPKGNVKTIQWGQHQATNEFVNVPNIVLAGTLFYRNSYYEGLKRLAADRPAKKGEGGQVTDQELERVVLGEHAHLVLQGLCRGRVRKCDGEFCQPMRAYIIASKASGISELMPELFPGCKMSKWEPVVRPLKGRVKAAIEYIKRWADASEVGDSLPFRQVAKAIRMGPHEFRRDVRMHPAFQDALAAKLGLEEFSPTGKNLTAFRSIASLFSKGDEAA